MIWTDRFYTVGLGSCCIETPYRGRHLLRCSLQLYNAGRTRHLSRKSERLDVPLFSGHLMTSGILGSVLILIPIFHVIIKLQHQIELRASHATIKTVEDPRKMKCPEKNIRLVICPPPWPEAKEKSFAEQMRFLGLRPGRWA